LEKEKGTCRKNKRKKEEEKEKREKQRRKKKQPTASHPSVKDHRPQERWIGATRNHRR